MGLCCAKHNSSSVEPLISSESLNSFDQTQSVSGQERSIEAWSIAGQLDEQYQRVAKFGLVEVAIDGVTGQPVIVISRCRFPSKKVFNQKNILQYLTYTLDKYVESDYSIVYFHYNHSEENRPTFSWLKEAYTELDRKYKKNLKCLYIVHPSPTFRIVLNLFKPVISVKFGKKLRYAEFLYEIASDVSLEQLPIPSEVLQYDKFLVEKHNPTARITSDKEEAKPTNTALQFGVSLHELENQFPNRRIPIVIQETIVYLKENGLQAEGLFRISPSAVTVQAVETRYNNGEKVTFDDPHVAAATLKSFFRKLPEPLLTFEFYQHAIDLMKLDSAEYISTLKNHLKNLPKRNYNALKYLINFLISVVDNSSSNKMAVSNLAIVFGPTLLWSTDEASMLTALHTINNLIVTLISQFDQLFTDDDDDDDDEEEEDAKDDENIDHDVPEINSNEKTSAVEVDP